MHFMYQERAYQSFNSIHTLFWNIRISCLAFKVGIKMEKLFCQIFSGESISEGKKGILLLASGLFWVLPLYTELDEHFY